MKLAAPPARPSLFRRALLPGRLRIRAAALLSSLVLAFPFTSPASATQTPSTSPSSSEPPRAAGIELDTVTPWLDPKGTLTISGTVTARTKIHQPKISVGISSRTLDSRERIEAWPESPTNFRSVTSAAGKPKDSTGAKPIERPTVPGTLESGQRIHFRFSIPASRLQLPKSQPAQDWGPRGLRIGLSGDAGDVQQAAPATAFTTWYPKPHVQPTKLTSLIPVTMTTFGEKGEIAPADLESAAVGGGALDAALAAARADKTAALAIDPRVLNAVHEAVDGTDPAEDDQTEAADTSAPADDKQDDHPELRSWWDDFRAEAQKHDIVALPWADPDLAAVSAAKLDRQRQTAKRSVRLVKDDFPKARTNVSWPAAGTASQSSLRTAAREGARTAVVSDYQQPGSASYTQSSRSQLALDENGSGQPPLATLIDDSRLSQLSQSLSDPKHRAAALSELVAQTAAITSERPSDSRSVLMSLPRTNASSSWQQATQLADQLPWLKGQSLSSLLDASPVDRGELRSPTGQASSDNVESIGGHADADQREAARGLSDASLRPLRSPAKRLDEYSSIFTDPAAARSESDRMMLTCASVGWTLRGKQSDCTGQAKEAVHSITSGISVDQGSSVLLVTGEKTTIPITVENKTGRRASLSVRLVPETPQLRTQESKRIELDAGERTRVDVPVEGLANADVEAAVSIVARDGYTLPADSSLLVRVRADWENIGVAVIGTALGIVFIVGLVLTIRRGRRKLPASQLDAALGRTAQSGVSPRDDRTGAPVPDSADATADRRAPSDEGDGKPEAQRRPRH